MVEECDLRFSEEDQEKILRIIAETLGKDEDAGEEEEANDVDMANGI